MVRLIISILACFFLISPAYAQLEGKLIIFHAGSLSAPLAEMERIFEAEHPDLDIVRKAGGSTKMARLISEHGKKADIMASADFAVIDKNLIPDYANWNIRFATNQMVLCYTDTSKYADKINSGNWYEILSKTGVRWGHSDPNLDPCGYRSLMVLQLAEKFYNKQGLYDQVMVNLSDENVFEKASQMVSVLKEGRLDYAWEYLSVAVQNNLNYLTLSDHINLGNYQYDNFYKQAKVKVTGKKTGTWMVRTGKSCVYGVTLIKQAQNKEAALAFLKYMLDPQHGLKILEQMGQPPFISKR